MKTQAQEILETLKNGENLTQAKATKLFRCTRLAARICDLRRDGHRIHTETVKRRSKRTGRIVAFAEYSLRGAK